MRNLYPFTLCCKQNGVVTYYVSGSHRGKTNSLVISGAGLALTAVDSDVF
jgi:hypothetical protein